MFPSHDLSGFTNTNNPTLAQVYRCAQNHVKDTYGIEMQDITEAWGEDVAKMCGLYHLAPADGVFESMELAGEEVIEALNHLTSIKEEEEGE